MATDSVSGTYIQLTASDAHTFDAYVADPGAAKRAIVVVQEIFGVNHHIRSVADDFATEGYLAIAPALFDRVQRGVELGYDPASRERGLRMAQAIGTDKPLLDIDASIAWAEERVGQHVGVVGYCWGGTLAWLSATRLRPQAAVGYYGGRIADSAAEKLYAPVMLHFGSLDKHIPATEIDKVRAAHPEVAIFLYDAGHGFNCSERSEYSAEAVKVARERTLQFFSQHLGSPK
jgi:carboxymethylenebutenolidase